MNYGLYLSATGVMSNMYRQDVIANNLANSESVGFKKDLALFQERKTYAQEHGTNPAQVNSTLENIGGGTLAVPTVVDTAPGEMEPTGGNLDVAIQGSGFFAVRDAGQLRLTRNGQFMVDRSGQLAMSNSVGQPVLDVNQAPIHLGSTEPVTISPQGTISQGGKEVGRIGVFDVSDPAQLKKEGGTLLSAPEKNVTADSTSTLHSGFIERSNVDPATELAMLMDTQRQLEANANMIRYQDQTLGELVNSVGKMS